MQPITPATVAELTLELDFEAPRARLGRADARARGVVADAFYMCQGPGPAA